MEAAPGLYVFKVPIPGPLEYVMAYLFRSEGGYTLVDSGWNRPDALAALKQQLADVGISLSDIRRQVFTHVHTDHFGLAARIKEETGAEVWLHERDWELIRAYTEGLQDTLQDVRSWLHMQGVPQQQTSRISISGQAVRGIVPRVQPDRTLRGGETVEGDDFRWEVIWTPGHSPGHICLYERSQQILLSGDHVLPVITPHISFSGRTGANPLGDYLQSLRALKPLKVGRVLPAHEHAFDDLQGRIQELEEHHEARMQEVFDTLAAAPMTPYEIAHHITWETGDFPELEFTMQGAALGETLAHLEYAVIGGRLRRSLDDGVYRYRLS